MVVDKMDSGKEHFNIRLKTARVPAHYSFITPCVHAQVGLAK